MDITTILIICAAIFGVVWVYPKLPTLGQWALAAIVAIACVLVLLKFAGIPISL